MKNRIELEGSMRTWRFLTIVFLMSFLAFAILSDYRFNVIQDLREENEILKQHQEKELIRESLVFYRCFNEDGSQSIRNILMDENNLSLYDYEIKEGCEFYR